MGEKATFFLKRLGMSAPELPKASEQENEFETHIENNDKKQKENQSNAKNPFIRKGKTNAREEEGQKNQVLAKVLKTKNKMEEQISEEEVYNIEKLVPKREKKCMIKWENYQRT